MATLLFTITEVDDYNLVIRTTATPFKDYPDLVFRVPKTNIYGAMLVCSDICNNKYNIGCIFELA